MYVSKIQSSCIKLTKATRGRLKCYVSVFRRVKIKSKSFGGIMLILFFEGALVAVMIHFFHKAR